MTITVLFKAMDVTTFPMKRMYENVDRYDIKDGLLILTISGENTVAIIPIDNILHINIEWVCDEKV